MAAAVSPECRTLVNIIEGAAPTLVREIRDIVGTALAPLEYRLESSARIPTAAKIFNDPVWGSIVLEPAEILLLDTALLQRLRGVRQLGMAQLVYQGAGYGRLEHVCGVIEGTERVINALHTSATRRAFSSSHPPGEARHLQALRLAALLHDVGHGPFSHVTEELINSHFQAEYSALGERVKEHFDDVLKTPAAELNSVLVILSEPMLRILMHSRFPLPEKENLPLIMVGAVLGSSRHLDTPYLSGVINGPIDADKLDYMVRDSRHAGLAIGLETTRLLSQLQVATVTEDNAPTSELRQRAAHNSGVIHQLGISRAGVSAFEQMIVSRAILYDRVYYHHKIRTAEAMLRRLIHLSEKDKGAQYSLRELLCGLSDDTFLCCVGGIVSRDGFPETSDRTKKLANDLLNRSLHKRAFAFATRFLSGFDPTEEDEKNDAIVLFGRKFFGLAKDSAVRADLERRIADCARKIGVSLGEKYQVSSGITEHDVIIDLPPPDKVGVRGKDVLVCSGSGEVELPNLYFDPEKWSRAYQVKKLVGFVFAPDEHVPAVNLAAKIVFEEMFGAVMSERAERICKTSRLHNSDMASRLVQACIITPDVAERLTFTGRRYIKIKAHDVSLPDRWVDQETTKVRLVEELAFARPVGYTVSEIELIKRWLFNLATFGDVSYAGGRLKAIQPGDENKLQAAALDHFRAAGIAAEEGSRFGGGVSDIVIDGELVIENKVLANSTDTPSNAAPRAGWQARRYSTAVSSYVVATIVGYVPNTERGIKATEDLLEVKSLDGRTVEIRLNVLIGYSNPSNIRGQSSSPA